MDTMGVLSRGLPFLLCVCPPAHKREPENIYGIGIAETDKGIGGGRSMAQDFSRGFYYSSAWKKCRASFIQHRIAEDGGLCQMCHSNIGYIVHHKVMLTADNINDASVTLNFDNLMYVCHECHNQIHVKEFYKLDYIFVDGMPKPLS